MLEEAFCLLRSTPLQTHAYYYIGTVPFLLAFLFFCSDMTRSPGAASQMLQGALWLTLLYFWKAVWQALYGCQLLGELRQGGGRKKSVGSFLRQTGAMVLVQSSAIPVLSLALILFVPKAWAVAFYQNASVLAYEPATGSKALRRLVGRSAVLSHFKVLENHSVLYILSFFTLFVGLNISVLFVFIPIMLKAFTGIETVFTTNPAAAMGSSMTLAITVALTVLVVGPLFKAVYVLRCFYGIAERTGDDLTGRLKSAAKRKSAAAAAVVVTLVFLGAPGDLSASDGRVEEMDDAIETVLKKKDYQWRLPRDGVGDDKNSEQGAVATFFEDLSQTLEEAIEHAKKQWSEFRDRHFNMGSGRGGSRGGFGLAGFAGLGGGGFGTFLLWGTLVCLAGFVIWFLVRSYRLRQLVPTEGVGGMVGLEDIDLESDEVSAGELEENEWLALARSKAVEGEYRLAVRAVFLAYLAHFSERRFVRLKRFKSNRDYLEELARKARGEGALQEAFSETTGVFEQIWYGEHRAGPELVESLVQNFRNRTQEGGVQ